jgi:predicted amidohydrolase YtcJ
MRLIWTVVNRLTRSGKVLGPDERISPYDALLSVTRNAAIQAFEEKPKGTLEKYKLADLVILN